MPADTSEYSRPPEIQSELDLMLGRDLTYQVSCARIPESSNGSMRNEVLVSLVRKAMASRNAQVHETLTPILMQRLTHAARRYARTFPQQHQEEVLEEIVGSMAERLAANRRMAFFECRFNRAFKCHAIDVCQKIRRRIAHEILEEDDPPEPLDQAMGEQFSAPELRQLLDRLTTEERDLVVLRYWVGCSINARDDHASLVRQSRRSERWVRSKLEGALIKLKRMLQEGT